MKLADFPQLGVISDPRERVSGEAFQALVMDRQRELEKRGVRAGHIAVLCQEGGVDFFVHLFALWEIGACVAPLPALVREAELASVLQQSGAAWLFHRGEWSEKRSSNAPLGLDAALLLHTSGTTGLPKGVMLSSDSIRRKLAAILGHARKEDFQESLCLLPVSFGHGLIGNSLAPLFAGGNLRIETTPGSLVASLGSYVDQHRITFFSSVPALWATVLPFSPPPKEESLRRVYCASARLSLPLWRQVRAWLGPQPEWKHVYGITELASWFCAPLDGEAMREEGYVGHPWGAELRVDERGEVLVRAPYLMLGYQGDPSGTAEVVQEGWFHTGDLGVLDESGALRLTGRLRELIHKGGAKVSPVEVELRLREHPAVADACVFGYEDPIAGESVGAAVVLAEGAQLVSAKSLRDHCRQTLSEFKVPERVLFLESLPRNERGKVALGELRALAALRAGS